MTGGRSGLGEGNTPVIELSDLASHTGLRGMWAKAEWINPTGSYKDRIAAKTMDAAVRCGARGWIGTSSGNAGAAMAAYGARAGLRGFLCVAADAPSEKLQSVAPYGAAMLAMSTLGPPEMDRIEQLALEYRLQLAITAYRYNPEGMAGAEAIGEELADQGAFTHAYVPAGGGGLLVAVARGLARRAPGRVKLVCAQPAGCAPIVGYLSGALDAPVSAACTTTVSGLQLPSPPDGLLAAGAVRESGGWGCAVTDQEAWDAQRLLATREGVFVEPAAALAVAAISRDVAEGRLATSDCPVAVLTGSGLKDLRRVAPAQRPSPGGLDDLGALLAAAFTMPT